VVDECSMMDVILANKLVRAIPTGAHLLLVGDVDQLPSVGAGEVLRDLLAAGTIPRVRLTEIFRQAQQSGIVVNAHRINGGQPPQLTVASSSTDRARRGACTGARRGALASTLADTNVAYSDVM
jgi:ATP-dependent exoDNAse (exonuclease V) alpha subunit